MNIIILGKNVKRLRQKRGITQEELASEVGISTRSLSSLENGIGNPGIETINRLAEAFEVESMVELLEPWAGELAG